MKQQLKYKVLRNTNHEEFEKNLAESVNREDLVVLGIQYSVVVMPNGKIMNCALVEYYLLPKPQADEEAKVQGD